MPARTVARRPASLFLSSRRRRGAATLLAIVLAAAIGTQPSDSASAAPGTSVVAGIVTGSDGEPAVGLEVGLRNDDGNLWSSGVRTDESGAYRFENLPASRYGVSFTCWNSCVGNYVGKSWHDMPWFDVAEGERVDVETELQLAGEISGVVRGDDGAILEGIRVHIASDTAGVTPPHDSAITDAEGRYRFRNLPAAGYLLRFAPDTAFAHEYFAEHWKDQATAGTADVVQVTAGEVVSGIDPALAPTAWISGRVVNEDGVPADWNADVNVFLYRITDAGRFWVDTAGLGSYPLEPGEFRFDGLTPGTYVLWTRSLGWRVGEWWHDTADLASAERIVVAAGDRFDATVVLEGGPVSLKGPTVSGTPRVGETLTAAASSPTPTATIAYQWFADDVPIDGANASAYALTAAELDAGIEVEVVASAPGRMTLTRRSRMTSDVQPAVLTSTIPRISGERVVGSTLTADVGDWSDGTEFAYEWRANGTAISGVDDAQFVLTPAEAGKQISVAVTGSKPGYVSVSHISQWVNVTYGPATLTTPVISGTLQVGSTLTASASSTTPGAQFSYTWYANGSQVLFEDEPTIELREEHHGAAISVLVHVTAPNYIMVQKISGTTAPVGSVGQAVTRLAGPDRYATSVAISKSQFGPGVPVAFIASSANFPDALAGAPAAGISGGPMLLTDPNALPDTITAELERLQPERIVILGGTGTISADVEALLDALRPGAVTRLAGSDRYATSVAISK
ncbi:carboxypeptidase regulatory-like domain-containing protein, partial [Agromyces subbeticus]|uniref:carboxypeptidase regulatory-like domain-containing protein n=1 Tax=Agromyces subbeticus TaxID=293890 RepID=UPI00047A9B67